VQTIKTHSIAKIEEETKNICSCFVEGRASIAFGCRKTKNRGIFSIPNEENY
jgi:hypothetical protein